MTTKTAAKLVAGDRIRIHGAVRDIVSATARTFKNEDVVVIVLNFPVNGSDLRMPNATDTFELATLATSW